MQQPLTTPMARRVQVMPTSSEITESSLVEALIRRVIWGALQVTASPPTDVGCEVNGRYSPDTCPCRAEASGSMQWYERGGWAGPEKHALGACYEIDMEGSLR